MPDATQDPVGALRELRAGMSASANDKLDVMRAAAIQLMTDRCIGYEVANEGRNSEQMRQEIAAMAEAARVAGSKTGDGTWTSLRQFLERAQLNLRLA